MPAAFMGLQHHGASQGDLDASIMISQNVGLQPTALCLKHGRIKRQERFLSLEKGKKPKIPKNLISERFPFSETDV